MKTLLNFKYDHIANIYFLNVNNLNDDDMYCNHFVLSFSGNTFKGKYKVFTYHQKDMIAYLIENKVIEVIETPVIYYRSPKFGIYKIRLTQSAMLELI